MGRSNLALRPKAIPFRSLWYDGFDIGNDFDGQTIYSDLLKVMVGDGGSVRMTRPTKGDLVELRLTIQGTAPTGAPTTLRFAIGTFDTDGITAIAPSETTISQHMTALFGSSAPLSYGSEAEILIDGISLMPVIPKKSDPDYNEDGFVLYVEINGSETDDITIREFKVDGSVQIGVL